MSLNKNNKDKNKKQKTTNTDTHIKREINMLPLSLLTSAQGQTVLVELKNGETYNGILLNCDTYMNMNLQNVVCTSRDGDKFWKIPSCYIRGNSIRYLCMQDEILDSVPEEPDPEPVPEEPAPAPVPSTTVQHTAGTSQSTSSGHGRGGYRNYDGRRGGGRNGGNRNGGGNYSSRQQVLGGGSGKRQHP